jgi:sec-independent protein translocase protein TatA
MPVTPLFSLFEGALSPMHILVVLIVGILLFGKRLPEMGRSLGKGLIEFKKGLQGLGDEIDAPAAPRQPLPAEQPRPPRGLTAAAPDFGGDARSATPPPKG